MAQGAITVGNRGVGAGHPAFIIAEIGINHEGSIDTCLRMIDEAAAAGADAIKLQTIDADANYVRGTPSHTLFSGAALSQEETAAAFAHARKRGILPFTTAGDFATIDWVDRLDPVAHKISSGLMNNLPVIAHTARKRRPLLISTGMATWPEIDATVQAASAGNLCEIALFHCVSLYPAAPEQLNLNAMARMRDRYQRPVGYSDHALGSEASVAAVAMGACMIEKHFTLDTTRPSFDHRLSLNPGDFRVMVDRIRQVEAMAGNPERPLSPAEAEMSRQMRRVVVTIADIPVGATFTTDNIALKRPLAGMQGLSPADFEGILGRKAARRLSANEGVTADAVQ